MASVAASVGYAQDEPDSDDDVNPGRNQSVLIRLNARTQYTDNFYYRPDGGQAVSGFIVEPRLNYARGTTRYNWTLSGKVEAGAFSVGSADNYVDTAAATTIAFDMPHGNVFALTGAFRHEHDPFGTVRTEGSPLADRDLDEWDEVALLARYARTPSGLSRLGIKVNGHWSSKEYTTNEPRTSFLNFDQLGGELELSWQFTPKTSTLIQYIYVRDEFDELTRDGRDRSGTAQALLLGGTWQATEKTSGDVRIGGTRRTSESSMVDDRTAAYWRAGVRWDPTSRTGFRLQTSQQFRDSHVQAADFARTRVTSLTWREHWNRRLSTRARGSYRITDLSGINEQDDYWSATFRVNYRPTPPLTVYTEVIHRRRESTRAGLDFERLRTNLGFSVDLN